MSGSLGQYSENESYTPSVVSIEGEDTFTPQRAHRPNGTFDNIPKNKKRKFLVSQDDSVKVVVGRSVYQFGDPI
jgi:hypothetical protein